MDFLNDVITEANNPREADFSQFLDAAGRPMFPQTIDSTILGTFRSCPQKAYRTYLQHWKPSSESVHLVAGGAFAKGVEVARRAFWEGKAEQAQISYSAEGKRSVVWTSQEIAKGNADDALALGTAALIATYGDYDAPPESPKSLERVAGALEFYFDQWPMGEEGDVIPIILPDGRSGIEFSFAEPLDVFHPISGDPILYTGRSDLIGKLGDTLVVADEKTTSALGASWLEQWDMRSQFTGYIWAGHRIGLDIKAAVVRGVSILKTKYGNAQVMTNRQSFEINRWYDQVNRDVERMIRNWKEGYWDYNLDHACNEYGKCSLQSVCKSESPESWLPVYFHRRVWDPLARRELTVAEWEAQWDHLKA